MRILGVDPGVTRCGVGVIEVLPGRKAKLVSVGVIRSDASMPMPERLLIIGQGIREVIERDKPQQISLERVFVRSDNSTVMNTANAAGVAQFVAAEAGVPVVTHTPSEVKAAVTGYGNADKAQVGHMVGRILGIPEVPKPADAADALALAICAAWRASTPVASMGSGTTSSETPAQKAWRAAESASRSGRSLKR